MDAKTAILYSELRKSRREIIERLNDTKNLSLIRPILQEELADIEAAIQKFESGTFGKCEISGELIPDRLLKILPTIKSLNDYSNVAFYFRKPI